ncbi:hypothetical protein O181_010609 [Austropuccinia psidii MF-1]|uniref:Uncharacterized protein n=1 Tax=Austropuccinia psidii MF-1 TaxID=1389203 RepID=A0A9Q3BRD6_9BASI|nr:hypothetical protein [Austropuccinia psidii MF-1]
MATNRWNKANFDAATLITSKVNRQVLNTIVNADISDKASSTWNKINELYYSKQAMNKGRVWLNWQKSNYTGNLQQYINRTRKFHMHPGLVSIKVPPEILSYIILGKLASDSNLTQIVDLLIVTNQLTEHPNQILLRLKEYVNLQSTKSNTSVSTSSKTAWFTSNNQTALNNSSNQPTVSIVNITQNASHKKEECYAENPHLRPPRQHKKCSFNRLYASAH